MDKRDMVDVNSSEEDYQKLYDILNEDDGTDAPAKSDNLPEKDDTQKGKKQEGWQKTLITYLHDIVFLLVGVVLIFTLIFRIVVVSGRSMNHTLVDGDFLLLLSSTFYRNPKQGDIVVVSKDSFGDGEPIVKRIVATEGQTVDIRDGAVYVNNVKLEEPYTWEETEAIGGMAFPATVPEGCVFVLGDNRGNSTDSRYPIIGFVDEREIVGKVIFLFLPGTNKGEQQKDYGRIGAIS